MLRADSATLARFAMLEALSPADQLLYAAAQLRKAEKSADDGERLRCFRLANYIAQHVADETEKVVAVTEQPKTWKVPA